MNNMYASIILMQLELVVLSGDGLCCIVHR
jgi:hypothetical protein